MTEVTGLPLLLRSVASRLENEVEGLSKDLLLEAAQKLERLEIAAHKAAVVVLDVPVKANKAYHSKVSRTAVFGLIAALNEAGRYGGSGKLIRQIRQYI